METISRFTDSIGPAKIIQMHEPVSGLLATLVIDNLAAGPALGGIRMATDVTVEECFRLARGMTLKNISAGIPHGGGKLVIAGDPKMGKHKKETIIRALASSLRTIQEYIPAPDMGTNEECMAWAYDEVKRVAGLPTELGGIPLDEIGATGWGLYHAIDVAAAHVGFPLTGARIVIQGFGAVGRHTALFLSQQGAIVIGISDSKGAIHNPDGFDLQALVAIKNQGGSVTDYAGAKNISREDLIGLESEVWVPAARPDVIDGTNASRLRTKIVAQGANIPCTLEAEKILHERGILCLPDYIANAGGVICAAMEYAGATKAMVMLQIEETLRTNTLQIIEASSIGTIQPRAAADGLAYEKLQRVMATKRWKIY